MNGDLKVHFFLGHHNPAASEAFGLFVKRYGQTDPQEATHHVVLGGDGALLAAMHELMDCPSPFFYGINYGNVGFLLNPPLAPREDLFCLLSRASRTDISPLKVRAVDLDGVSHEGWAFNDVAISHTKLNRVIHMTVKGEKDTLYERLWGDGLIVSTPIGSTGYNTSAGGRPILPGSDLMLVTPSNPMRLLERPDGSLEPTGPQRIKPQAVYVKLQRLDWRQAAVCTDHLALTEAAEEIFIWPGMGRTLTLLHHPEYPLREKYKRAAAALRASRGM